MHRDEATLVRQCSVAPESHSGTRLGFVPVTLKNGNQNVVTYALLDNGSDVTLLSERIADRLNIKGEACSLRVRTSTLLCQRVSVALESLDGESLIVIDSAYVVKQLPVDCAEIPSDVDLKVWPHLSDICVTRLRDNEVGMLLGGNVPEAHWVLDQRVGKGQHPYAVKTLFGWTLRGPN
ncbi:hypothetical protein [Streptococcus dysgalactiae]|uniref:hypothetical protein n=1 Tax=Streptococcus dysgalactiae TaxID=1334 RepID=UPI0019511B1B|nr:hypothetical protein [Streptococcus dysgalactiae]MBM6549258.1 hypothetical protein [Streptococcus dysgalactiae subsp. equisimilis]